ncbi:unnamed protein product [Rhodiola kirilowii]
MAYWSAENATNAFINTLKMGQSTKEPDEAEFISALAAGNNAQLMVFVASPNYVTNFTILTALSAAAYQTNSRVVCIFATLQDYQASILEPAHNIDFVVGHAQRLLFKNYRDADFVLVDCENMTSYEEVVMQMQKKSNNGAIVVGYNALCKDSTTWQCCGSKTTHLLPIGRGLLVTRIPPSSSTKSSSSSDGDVSCKKKSRWVVKVDQSTGEEHVFRVMIPRGY